MSMTPTVLPQCAGGQTQKTPAFAGVFWMGVRPGNLGAYVPKTGRVAPETQRTRRYLVPSHIDRFSTPRAQRKA